MSEFFEAAGVNELKDGTMKKIKVSEHWILLAMVKGRYYAVDAFCPHLEGDLFEGILHETTLTCPMHHSQFDVRDGHVIRWTDQTGNWYLDYNGNGFWDTGDKNYGFGATGWTPVVGKWS